MVDTQTMRAYFDGSLSPQEQAHVRAWLRAHAGEPEVDQMLLVIWESLPEGTHVMESLLAYERFKTKNRKQIHKKRLFVRWMHNVAAALVIPLLVAAGYQYYQSTLPDVVYKEVYAKGGTTDSLVLADNTKVWLNAGSRLVFPEQFDKKSRQVFLSGEAHFQVASDAKKPFILSFGHMHLKVLGTEFNVRSYEDISNTTVSLFSGSVELWTGEGAARKTLLLKPEEMATFNNDTGELVKNTFSLEDYFPWQNGGLYFQNQDLQGITAQMERMFNVRITIRDNNLKKVRYGVAFVNQETLDQMLQQLNADNSMIIRRQGDVIDITSNK